ncbi:nucleotidyltransferase family protein [Bacillus sp. 1P06AnD]|uniref:nucleotidyltransferase family protein n=1 Tax=Bacillus sp. 1P06AnD TaxID=3132208 RepID=UPI0039A2F944
MMIQSEQNIEQLISRDQWMMDILQTVQQLKLPDWWICAGFIRNKIWDTLHGKTVSSPLGDVDVVYFDRVHTEKEHELYYEEQLIQWKPNIPWSVKNQARMHKVNHDEPYHSSMDAIAKFPETVTAAGATLDNRGNLVLSAPHGWDDLLNMIVRPTPIALENAHVWKVYNRRKKVKNWSLTWEKVIYADIASPFADQHNR